MKALIFVTKVACFIALIVLMPVAFLLTALAEALTFAVGSLINFADRIRGHSAEDWRKELSYSKCRCSRRA